MAQKFRKKPVIIEAVQVPSNESLDLHEWVEKTMALEKWMEDATFRLSRTGIHIQTLEGVMTASPGDWIIRGVKGEYYPCKPDIFEATYEVVTE